MRNSTLPEISQLFSELALHLQTPSSTDPSIDLSISKLAQSLSDNARVRVLDTALSLMCFKAPQVFDAVIEYSLKTIVCVLSSSISCKVLRFQNEEALQMGSFISRSDCAELIEFACDVIPKLEEHGMPIHLLLSAVVRVAASASVCKCSSPLMHALDVEPIDGRSIAVSKLLRNLPSEFSLNNQESPLRLLFWYLDPLALKHDISKILQETMQRPFLSLSTEFYERMDWRSILICLVLSPVMFIDTRALLHDWFLLTGLSPILELLVELVSAILDIISRPSWWGLSIELGSKLPFSNAYFPYASDFLMTLTGPTTCEGFLELVHRTSKSACLYRKQLDRAIKPSAVRVASIDHQSLWALAVIFPDWFYFASVLLFFDYRSFQLKCSLGVPKFGQTDSTELPAAAATYIAWILNPLNKSNQEALIYNLTTLSECWTPKDINSGNSQKGMAGYRKKFKKPRFCNSKEDFTLGNKRDCQVITTWLKQFHHIMKHDETIDDSAFCEAKSYVVKQRHKLFRRIPLGILIGSSYNINEDGCELLLHYAATGKIHHSLGSENTNLKHENQNSIEPEDLFIGVSKMEAIAGACLVFSLTDAVERMSASFSETEESGVDFICVVKVMAGRYLIKCIKRLIHFNGDEDGVTLLLDLRRRLERWSHQGKEVLDLRKDLDDAVEGLTRKLSL